MRPVSAGLFVAGVLILGVLSPAFAQENKGVLNTVLIEAETFVANGTDAAGLKRILWGENDYKANFANANLSRQAGFQLGAVTGAKQGEKQGEKVGGEAVAKVVVPADGVYRLMVRYEAPHGFDGGFEVVVAQGEKRVKRTFGKLEGKKLWPFGEGFKSEVVWDWGANENIVWEGDDFEMALTKGEAVITMVAQKTGDRPPAKRNIDCLILTNDLEGLKLRLEKETNMPLASWLTQSGDLWVRVVNRNKETAVRVTLPDMAVAGPGERREAVVVDVGAGQTSGWVEVGGLLQTFAPGRWTIGAASAKPAKGAAPEVDCVVEFGSPAAVGPSVGRSFELKGRQLELAYEPSLRDVGLEKGLKPIREVLFGYLAELEKVAAPGKAPTKVPVSAISFGYRQGDAEYNAAVDRFNALLGVNAPSGRGGVRGEPPVVPGGVIMPFGRTSREKMKESLEGMKAKGQLANVAGFMIGSETANNLFGPQAGSDEDFRAFLKARGITSDQADVNAGEDWGKVHYLAGIRRRELTDGEEYCQAIYEHELRIREVMTVSDALRQYVPEALVAINFNSYMVPSEKGAPCLGPTYSFAQSFRRKALTLPWVQDYMFWMPVGSPVMQFLNVDLMRAGIRHYPRQAMAASIMPQSPGNNPRAWRRMVYGHMAHGVNRFDLFQIAPIQVGNPRYHVTDGRMFAEIRKVTHEMGTFDDLLVDSKVPAAQIGMFFSEAGDINGGWKDERGAAKTAMYADLTLCALRPDAILEEDLYDGTLGGYKVLVLCDSHVSAKASEAIAQWVKKGGMLIATQGAGCFDEFGKENTRLLDLMGCRVKQEAPPRKQAGPVFFMKQDMMNAVAVDTSLFDYQQAGDEKAQKVGFRRAVLKPVGAGKVIGTYGSDGAASVVVTPGVGKNTYATVAFGFYPGLNAFKSDQPIGRTDRFLSPAHASVAEISDVTVSKWLHDELCYVVGGPVVGSMAMANVAVGSRQLEVGWVESAGGVVVPVVCWANWEGEQTLEINLDGLRGEDLRKWEAFDHEGQKLKFGIREDGSKGGTPQVKLKFSTAGAVVLRKRAIPEGWKKEDEMVKEGAGRGITF
jgi:hypothetical protein